MKKIYTLAAAFAISMAATAQIDYQEDFEGFDLGDISAQAANWRTWSGAPGGDEDADVTDLFANSGTKSLTIGGNLITDQLLIPPTSPSSGEYTIQWEMYIPTAKSAYFNMQAADSPGAWEQALMAGNVYYNCDGSMGGSAGVTGTIDCSAFDESFTYPQDEWFTVTNVYNLDDQFWSQAINGVVQFTEYDFEFGTQVFEELAALDFFSANASIEMYIDDVVMGPNILSTNDFAADSFSVYPNPVNNVLNIRSQNAVSNIAVYDLLGKVVAQSSPNVASPSIDMSGLASGAYLVNVTINGTSNTVKVIK